MGSFSSELESRVCAQNTDFYLEDPETEEINPDLETLGFVGSETDPEAKILEFAYSETYPDAKVLEFEDSMAYPEPETLEYDDSVTYPDEKTLEFLDSKSNPDAEALEFSDPEREMLVRGFKQENSWRKMRKKKKNQVFLEGYVEAADEDDLMRTKSLTDEDLDELKGCLDLGFGFSYEEIPELCNTLPALELCYSMSQKFLDEQQKSPECSPVAASDTSSPASGPIANWRISSPGDHPEEVKARLKFWAQAVACTVRLCS